MRIRRISGDGPTSTEIMLIGERPGKVENAVGKPFQGPSGQELDRYLLTESSLDRGSIFVTNLVRDYSDEPPSAEEIDRDMPELLDEINRIQPKCIGLVGLHSARAFLGTVEMEWAHGLLFQYPGFAMMPLYHPAAGMHQPSLAAKVAWDFGQFGKLVRGEALSVSHLSNGTRTDYSLWSGGPKSITCRCGVDTEGTVESPWCVSVSVRPGQGTVHRKAPVHFSSAILHNAIHDLPVLEALGCRVTGFTDTMVMAALLGTEPLSLKALARRHCGMRMREYAQVVAEAAREKALEYLSRVLDSCGPVVP